MAFVMAKAEGNATLSHVNDVHIAGRCHEHSKAVPNATAHTEAAALKRFVMGKARAYATARHVNAMPISHGRGHGHARPMANATTHTKASAVAKAKDSATVPHVNAGLMTLIAWPWPWA